MRTSSFSIGRAPSALSRGTPGDTASEFTSAIRVSPPFWDLRRLSFTESFRQFVETELETTEPLPTLAELAEMVKRAT